MIKWKDFLYFSKKDKTAIILLSLMILVCGIFYICLSNFSTVDPEYINQAEETQNDFTYFEEQMTLMPAIEEDTDKQLTTTPPSSDKKQKSKTNNTKLTEGQTLDINTASKQTLTRIPGIGEAFADRIIDYRSSLGGFASLDQLTEIKGITTKKFSKILPYVVIKKKHQLIKINKMTEQRLLLYPYFNEGQVKKILTLRAEKKLTSIDDLAKCNEFTARDIDRLSAYISFE